MDNKSSQYFAKLARDLKPLYEESKDAAQLEFEKISETIKYKLADIFYTGSADDYIKEGVNDYPDDVATFSDVGCSDYTCGDGYFVSNEPSLFKSFEYIEDKEGVGIGVGVDQMLDIFINTQIDSVYLIDISRTTHIASRILLEIGRRHKKIFKKYPKPQEFLEYFEIDNAPQTYEFIKYAFNTELDLDIAQNIIGLKDASYYVTDSIFRQVAGDSGVLNTRMYYYLKSKINQSEFTSWLSNQETLSKTFSAYEDGHILLVNSDMAGSKESGVPRLSKYFKENEIVPSIVYLSNAEQYIKNNCKTELLWKNIANMDIADDTIVINTTTHWPYGDIVFPKYARDYIEDVGYGAWGMAVRTAYDVFADKQRGDTLVFSWKVFGDRVEELPDMYNSDMVEDGLIVSRSILNKFDN